MRGEEFWVRLVGHEVKLFLKNGFKYQGKLTATNQDFIEILDYKLGLKKILRIEQVEDLEVLS